MINTICKRNVKPWLYDHNFYNVVIDSSCFSALLTKSKFDFILYDFLLFKYYENHFFGNTQ